MNIFKKIKTAVLPKIKKYISLSLVYSFLVFISFFIVSWFSVFSLETQDNYHFVSLIFTLLWSCVFTAIILVLPKKMGQIVYGVVYMFLLTYGICEHVYHNIFDKMFSFTVIANIKEGAGYVKDILSFIGIWQITVYLLLVIFGIIVIRLIGKISSIPFMLRISAVPVTVLLIVISQYFVPPLLGEYTEKTTWNSFEDSRYVYEKYTDPHKCVGMVGYYQYLWMDFHNCFIRPYTIDTAEQKKQVDVFFSEYRKDHVENEFTSLLKGKSAIVVMLESIDWLAVSPENTPTISMMMDNGISFTNYYASVFGDGATFSNEFVLNTGIYSPSNGTAAYSFKDNAFPNSLPNLFRAAGYSVESFHHNYGWFYNRSLMHMGFGYERYNSYYDYGGSWEEVIVDTYLTRTEPLVSDVFGSGTQPFLSFVITYSAHLGYTYDAELAEYAFDTYVGENGTGADSEDIDVLRAKARITDAMLKDLVQKADKDTVIICVTDHYAYGLTEETLNETHDTEWALRQRVPFFIYCNDPSIPSMKVDKICSNADFLPTIANLFGLDLSYDVIGNDIFDPEYEGYAVFSNYSFLTNDVYWHDEVVRVYNEDYSESDVHDMIRYVYNLIPTNDNILECNYYKKK